MSGKLDGKIAIVTGGTGGIGKATVELFLEEGAKVAAVDINEEKLKELEKEVHSEENLLIVQADVSKEADVKNYVDTVVEKFGRIDILFNNAGILGDVKPFLEQTIDNFDKVLSVNVRGSALGLLNVLPVMAEQKSGSVINTSSISGLIATNGFAPYDTSKHAVNGLTKNAAKDVAKYGIRVNSIHPSQVDTDMVKDVESGINAEDTESVKSELQAAIPMGRYAKPEEVAKLVLFLASDDSEFITGSQYRIDGGLVS
ncbi:SDR family oxidoreductase [Oceanobacillus sp. FSL W7-1293]|uniref:SDR family NAD(P)-dependent oxidoreductase n=1 Tax=Oceanobacillus sp. FSL W7-1293 TaxID=2921699 RepID=UPI0030D12F17